MSPQARRAMTVTLSVIVLVLAGALITLLLIALRPDSRPVNAAPAPSPFPTSSYATTAAPPPTTTQPNLPPISMVTTTAGRTTTHRPVTHSTTRPKAPDTTKASGTSASAAAKVMDGFLSAVAKNDLSGAKGFTCKNSLTAEQQIAKKLKARRSGAPKSFGSEPGLYKAHITGSMQGKPIDQHLVPPNIGTGVDYETQEPCVLSVFAVSK